MFIPKRKTTRVLAHDGQGRVGDKEEVPLVTENLIDLAGSERVKKSGAAGGASWTTRLSVCP